MFWSKIWYFLVAVFAMLAVGLALAVPRPAERRILEAEDRRLEKARDDVELLLGLDAHARINNALTYTRHDVFVELKKIKEDNPDTISQQVHDSARGTLEQLQNGTQGVKPSFLISVDAWGRVVARVGQNEKAWGDDLSGYYLVRDALRGYMRDDLWLVDRKLFRVAAAPVIARPIEQSVEGYVGALVVGQEVDESLARELEPQISSACEHDGGACDTHVAFFVGENVIANSGPTVLATDIKQEVAKIADKLSVKDDKGNLVPVPAFTIQGETSSVRVAVKRLPGEVGAQDGFYAVYRERPRSVGFMGSLAGLVKGDLSFGNFPWIALGAGLVLLVLLGVALMWVEADRPLKRLTHDALALGKGDARSLAEDQHRGKWGSIARSVNLALDRLSRDGKKPRADLGALYETEGDAKPLPPSAPSGGGLAFSPPPPSDLAIDTGPAASFTFDIPPPPPPATGAGPVPPPMGKQRPEKHLPPAVEALRKKTSTGPLGVPVMPPPPPIAPATNPPRAKEAMPASLEDDILGHTATADLMTPPPPALPSLMPDAKAGQPPASDFLERTPAPELPPPPLEPPELPPPPPDGEEAYFRQVYEDFIELKKKCGESVESLTFEKFSGKLVQNRDQLIAKYACKAVKFQVYVKDGKAALKATPIRS